MNKLLMIICILSYCLHANAATEMPLTINQNFKDALKSHSRVLIEESYFVDRDGSQENFNKEMSEYLFDSASVDSVKHKDGFLYYVIVPMKDKKSVSYTIFFHSKLKGLLHCQSATEVGTVTSIVKAIKEGQRGDCTEDQSEM